MHHDKVEHSRWQNGVGKYQWLGPEPNQIAWLRASHINCLDDCLNDYLRLAHHVAIVLLMHPFSDLERSLFMPFLYILKSPSTLFKGLECLGGRADVFLDFNHQAILL